MIKQSQKRELVYKTFWEARLSIPQPKLASHRGAGMVSQASHGLGEYLSPMLASGALIPCPWLVSSSIWKINDASKKINGMIFLLPHSRQLKDKRQRKWNKDILEDRTGRISNLLSVSELGFLKLPLTRSSNNPHPLRQREKYPSSSQLCGNSPVGLVSQQSVRSSCLAAKIALTSQNENLLIALTSFMKYGFACSQTCIKHQALS